MTHTPPPTVDEWIAVCIARHIQDGELVAQGLATPLAAVGYLLAKCTHAPQLRFASAIGQGVCESWSPLGVTRIEWLWLTHSLMNVGFVTGAMDLLPTLHLKEFLRPAQVDAYGNTNNLALGADIARPRMRLPGAGGIPDVTPTHDRLALYVPRHSKITFVETCDFISGVGHQPNRIAGNGPTYLVSDLGEFDWNTPDRRMQLIRIFPGVTIERIVAKTGFTFEVAPHLSETPPPTEHDLHLLREVIDPLGVRKLETLSGSARRDHLREIIVAEMIPGG
jgi:acyl CoA:acetate/3-ketoacid CoA transferase beta subunit